MGTKNAVRRMFEDFDGYILPLPIASAAGARWVKKDTSAAGAPTMVSVTGKTTALRTLLEATSEAQVMTLYWGDILQIKLDYLKSISFRLQASAITTAEGLVFGVGSAQNDTTDSVTYNAWFKLAASTAILCETDDGATDTDDKSTGIVLPADTWKEFTIDFSNGLSDVRFHVGDANGKLTRVCPKTTFTMAGAAGQYVQPFVQLQKASGTTTPNVDIDWIDLYHSVTGP